MSLFCSIRGSVSAGEDGWVTAESEQCECDEWLGSFEAERDSGEEPDLGVGGLDESLGQSAVEVVVDCGPVSFDLAAEIDEGRDLGSLRP